MNPITVEEFFNKKNFEIPKYQRGYKWGVPDKDQIFCAVEDLCIRFIESFDRNDPAYFIEAVTVVEKDGKVILVDGQQRTTTLYLMCVALGYFDEIKNVHIEYSVRKDSDEYLKLLKQNNGVPIENNDCQDIYFFNKAIETIKKSFKEIDSNSFKTFLFERVKLLYNTIDSSKAITVFTSLNGLKAKIKPEELIKSELLIKAARNDFPEPSDENKNENKELEWKVNEDRARMAYNWDKWLYWWNDAEHKKYYNIKQNVHPLYYLLVTYWNINKSDLKQSFCFESFKTTFLSDTKKAKFTFDGLRKLQKSFEDIHNDYHKYNYMGVIFKTMDSKLDAIQYFINGSSRVKIDEYALFSIVGATHNEIINDETELIENIKTIIKQRKAEETINILENNELYGTNYELACKILLLLNVQIDDNLKRRFDFSIWDNKSLEHIHPQSKADDLNFTNDGSVHCLGNLLLLDKNDNSSFNDKDFEDKKAVFFDISKNYKSKQLLHTLSVFAKSTWNEQTIIENKISILTKLKQLYGIN